MQIDEIVKEVKGETVANVTREKFDPIYESIQQMGMIQLNQLDNKLAIGAREDDNEYDPQYDPDSLALATISLLYSRKSELIIEEAKKPDVNVEKLIELIKISFPRMWMLPHLAHCLDKEIEDRATIETIEPAIFGIAGYISVSIACKCWFY